MKTFKEFIGEAATSYSAFGLPRSQMPQLKDIEQFKNYLTQLGITYSEDVGSMSLYKPTQVEFDEYKVRNINLEWRRNPDSAQHTKPVILSDDDFVLDGHHRYFAAIRANQPIKYIQVSLPINKLLKLALEYTEAYG